MVDHRWKHSPQPQDAPVSGKRCGPFPQIWEKRKKWEKYKPQYYLPTFMELPPCARPGAQYYAYFIPLSPHDEVSVWCGVSLFTDGEIKSQKGEVTCSVSPNL